jgi:hypothetical protein
MRIRHLSTETKWPPGPWQVTQCRNGSPYVNIFRVSGPANGTKSAKQAFSLLISRSITSERRDGSSVRHRLEQSGNEVFELE